MSGLSNELIPDPYVSQTEGHKSATTDWAHRVGSSSSLITIVVMTLFKWSLGNANVVCVELLILLILFCWRILLALVQTHITAITDLWYDDAAMNQSLDVFFVFSLCQLLLHYFVFPFRSFYWHYRYFKHHFSKCSQITLHIYTTIQMQCRGRAIGNTNRTGGYSIETSAINARLSRALVYRSCRVRRPMKSLSRAVLLTA